MRTSSETPSHTEHPPSPGSAALLGAIAMSVTLSSASESEHSSADSTGSNKMSSVKKRRSSESSGQTADTGRSKRTKGSEESGECPPTPKAKTDGWSDDMKRVYEQAAFALPPSGREQRRLFGDMRGRNEQLGLWVTLEIGTYCGRKRISSHSQTLKNHHSTNPELKKFLTTDSSCQPTSPSDPYAWPLRLKQIVHRAYSSLPNPPVLPPVHELDLANIALPAIPVRVLRKDGVEVEMTLPDAIEYDKADQRMKNREKKPIRGRPSAAKKSRTSNNRADSSYSGGGGGRDNLRNPGARSGSVSSNYSPGPMSAHSRAMSNNVPRDVDRQTRYRQYSHNNADLSPHEMGHAGPSGHRGPPGAPVYWESSKKGRDQPGHPSAPFPIPRGNMPAMQYGSSSKHQQRYEPSEESDDEDGPRQPHQPSLDFIMGKPVPRSPPPAPRTFWKP